MSNVTDISAWKKGNLAKPVDLPSGMVARLKVSGMESFVTSGVIPNSLMGIIVEQLEKGKKGQSADIDTDAFMEDIKNDPQKLVDLIELVDRVAIKSFVEPVLHPAPDSEAERRDDRLYVDEVSHEDKFFVFNYASGGSSDLKQFREAAAPGVDAVPNEPEVEGSPE